MICTTFSLLLISLLTSSSLELDFSNNHSTTSGPDDFETLDKTYGNILCRSCGNEIAFSKDLIEKFSPSSLESFKDSIFDRDEVLIQVFVGNFILNHPVIISSTANCAGIHEWEEGFWYPGYRWKPCVCPDCGEYIGWVFEPLNSDVDTTKTFYGLILTSLIGESCKYTLISCQFSDDNSWRIIQVNMTTTDTMSAEDKEFLASCEEDFKDRYTENDKEFMKVFNSEPSTPPIMETWWVPQNSGRRNDRRHNRRNHPYERNREHDREDRRGYNDVRDQSYRNHRPRHY